MFTKEWFKQNWKSLAIIGAAGVLIVVILVVALVSLLGGSKNDSQSSTSSEDSSVESVCAHVWGEANVKVEATCLNNGVVEYECTLCEETKEEEIPQTACSYTKTVVTATCLKDGADVYTCGTCGDSYKQVTVRATGHKTDGAFWTVQKDEYVEGCLWYHVETTACTVCSEPVTYTSEFYKHEYSVKIETLATCSQNGEKLYVCDDCGYEYTEAYSDSNAHSWNEIYDGNIVKQSCECGASKTLVDARGNVETTVTSSTLKEAGSIGLQNAEIAMDEKALNKLSGDVFVSVDTVSKDSIDLTDDALAKLGENPIYDFSMSADGNPITEFGGNLTVTVPYDLSDGEDPENIVVAYINNQGNLDYYEAVYSIVDGQGYATFTTNHFSYYTVVRMTPAQRCAFYGCNNKVTVVEATCGVQGYTLTECTRCHKASRTAFTPADTHAYKKTTTAATCSAKGYSVYKCSKCGDKYTSDFTEKLAHSYKANTVAATCTAEGYIMHACENCGNAYTTDKVPALGHNYANDVCKVCGKKDPNVTGNFYLHLLESVATAKTYYVEWKDVTMGMDFDNGEMVGSFQLDLARLMLGYDDTGLIGKGEGSVVFVSESGMDFPEGSANATVVFANGMIYIEYFYEADVDGDHDKLNGYVTVEQDGIVEGMMERIYGGMPTEIADISSVQTMANDLWNSVAAVENSPLNNTLKVVTEYVFKKEAVNNGYTFTLNYDRFLNMYEILRDESMAAAFDLVFGKGAFDDTVAYIKGSLNKTVPQFEQDVDTELKNWGVSLDKVYDMINDIMKEVTGEEGDIRDMIGEYDESTISQILDEMTGSEGESDYAESIEEYVYMMKETTFMSVIFGAAEPAASEDDEEVDEIYESLKDTVDLLRGVTISFMTDKDGTLVSINVQANEFSADIGDSFFGKGESAPMPGGGSYDSSEEEEEVEKNIISFNGSYSIVLNGSYVADYSELIQRLESVNKAYDFEEVFDSQELKIFKDGDEVYVWSKKYVDDENDGLSIYPTQFDVIEELGTEAYQGQTCAKYQVQVQRLYKIDSYYRLIQEDCMNWWKVFDEEELNGSDYLANIWVNADEEIVGVEVIEQTSDDSWKYWGYITLYYNSETGEYSSKSQHNLKLVETKKPNGCVYGERVYECSICGYTETEYYGRGHVYKSKGELVQGATSCKQGAIITTYCTECGDILYTEKVKYHDTYQVKELVGTSQVCGDVYVEAWTCACGEEYNVYGILADCLFDSVDWEYPEDAENLNITYHSIVTYRCAVNACGHEYTLEEINRYYQDSNGECYYECKEIYSFANKTIVERDYHKEHWESWDYSDDGRTVMISCRLCGEYLEERRYDQYDRQIYNYSYESNSGWRKEFLDENEPCWYTRTWFDESGDTSTEQDYDHVRRWASHKESCTQYSPYGEYCELCDYENHEWRAPDYWYGDNGHDWYYNGTEYVCHYCGTRSVLGANGLISLEDMYKDGAWKVGYFNYRRCDMENEVDVEIIVNYQEDGSGVVLNGDLYQMEDTTPWNAYDDRESGIVTVDMNALKAAIQGMNVETISVVFWVYDESKTMEDENGNPKQYYLAHAVTFTLEELGLAQ